jgi:hypothetical protein
VVLELKIPVGVVVEGYVVWESKTERAESSEGDTSQDFKNCATFLLLFSSLPGEK